MAIFETTLQLILSAPKLYIPKPTIAPTIVCVVETGHPLRLAIINHDPAANKEEIIYDARQGQGYISWVASKKVTCSWQMKK